MAGENVPAGRAASRRWPGIKPAAFNSLANRRTQFFLFEGSSPDATDSLRTFLDAGEAEAITLAEEVQANLILIDELAGREFARQCGFAVLGTLGILLRAKQLGFCAEVRPCLDRLQQEINFFVSPHLRASILQQAGE